MLHISPRRAEGAPARAPRAARQALEVQPGRRRRAHALGRVPGGVPDRVRAHLDAASRPGTSCRPTASGTRGSPCSTCSSTRCRRWSWSGRSPTTTSRPRRRGSPRAERRPNRRTVQARWAIAERSAAEGLDDRPELHARLGELVGRLRVVRRCRIRHTPRPCRRRRPARSAARSPTRRRRRRRSSRRGRRSDRGRSARARAMTRSAAPSRRARDRGRRVHAGDEVERARAVAERALDVGREVPEVRQLQRERLGAGVEPGRVRRQALSTALATAKACSARSLGDAARAAARSAVGCLAAHRAAVVPASTRAETVPWSTRTSVSGLAPMRPSTAKTQRVGVALGERG